LEREAWSLELAAWRLDHTVASICDCEKTIHKLAHARRRPSMALG